MTKWGVSQCYNNQVTNKFWPCNLFQMYCKACIITWKCLSTCMQTETNLETICAGWTRKLTLSTMLNLCPSQPNIPDQQPCKTSTLICITTCTMYLTVQHVLLCCTLVKPDAGLSTGFVNILRSVLNESGLASGKTLLFPQSHNR